MLNYACNILSQFFIANKILFFVLQLENTIKMENEEKRAWKDLTKSWGKRAWGELQAGWGKRLSEEYQVPSLTNNDDKKRAWSSLHSSGWGKRGWTDLQSAGWGKRGWSDLQSAGWGKRGWSDLQSAGWGKRAWSDMQSTGWGKRTEKGEVRQIYNTSYLRQLYDYYNILSLLYIISTFYEDYSVCVIAYNVIL